jgi:hypothetical protein
MYRYFRCCYGNHLRQTLSMNLIMSVDSVIFIKSTFMKISKENVI